MSQAELFCLCRRGFEKEVSAELVDLAAACEVFGYVKAKPDTGYVSYVCQSFDDAKRIHEKQSYRSLMFIRHWFICLECVRDIPVDDRASPLAKQLEQLPKAQRIDSVYLDTNEGKSLHTLSKALVRHIEKKTTQDSSSLWIGQLLFLDSHTACIGVSLSKQISPWPSGIMHLRVPRQAPSRATLKLEEAWHQFIPKKDWDKRLAPSMRAVDLGAAPGGWTWQLVNRHMFVDAVDNGPMAEPLMESGQVTHRRVDGFAYKPTKSVDWLVCDIADKPSRVTKMIIGWAKNRWFKEAVFNLKLPMKQRYQAVCDAKSAISEALLGEEIKYQLRVKQLYHDREEVTVHLRLFD